MLSGSCSLVFTNMNDFSNINLNHPQQDILRVRQERPNLVRYRLAERLLPDMLPGSRVLEIGCGRAEFARRLRELNVTVTVTDLSPTNIQFASELGFEAHQLDLNRGLPVFSSAQFDSIVILDVIEHIVAAEFLLSEIRRVLRPNGFLVLSTPNFAWWLNRLRILFGQLSHDEGYHYRFFTRRSLENQLITAGFVPEVWRFNSPAFGVNWLRRTFWQKDRLHMLTPNFLGSLLGQTLYVRARAAYE